MLGQKLVKWLSWFFGRIEDTTTSFWNFLTFWVFSLSSLCSSSCYKSNTVKLGVYLSFGRKLKWQIRSSVRIHSAQIVQGKYKWSLNFHECIMKLLIWFICNRVKASWVRDSLLPKNHCYQLPYHPQCTTRDSGSMHPSWRNTLSGAVSLWVSLARN